MQLSRFLQQPIDSSSVYVIAEIGNNHQGNLEKCLDLVSAAHAAGASAVKFQKRENNCLFQKSFYDYPYNNPNSFGETYGLHRDALELSKSDLTTVKAYAESLGIDFFATPFDFASLEVLEDIGCPFYKVASADIVHTPLIRRICETKKPILISTGSSSLEDIKRAVDIVKEHSLIETLVILHCTASYPAQIKDMNLSCIRTLKRIYPDVRIGLSDHEDGIDAAPIAYMLGARIFEKHFTLSRSWKGTDNSFSLTPDGLRRLVRNLNRIDDLIGSPTKAPLDSEAAAIYKMRKSICYSSDMYAGTRLTESSFDYRCPGNGLPPYKIDTLLGKKLSTNVKNGDLAKLEDVLNA